MTQTVSAAEVSATDTAVSDDVPTIGTRAPRSWWRLLLLLTSRTIAVPSQ